MIKFFSSIYLCISQWLCVKLDFLFLIRQEQNISKWLFPNTSQSMGNTNPFSRIFVVLSQQVRWLKKYKRILVILESVNVVNRPLNHINFHLKRSLKRKTLFGYKEKKQMNESQTLAHSFIDGVYLNTLISSAVKTSNCTVSFV